VTPAPRRRTRAAPAIDILVKSSLWLQERGIRAVLRDAITQAAWATGSDGELAIVLSDDEAVRALNRDWRRKDQSTNVLSFPAVCAAKGNKSKARQVSQKQKRPRAAADARRCLGDIVIAYETAGREAKAEGKPLRDHVAHLAVHGFLHLVGYDHEGDAEAAAMEALEIAVLGRIGVPDPYVAPADKR
jgi:probable rRNA maturation factor